MKLKEAIRKADALRPNPIDEELKATWVAELEGRVAETAGMDQPTDGWAENDPELIMPYPYDDIYVFYVMAKIDFANEEMDLYANDSVMANERIDEALAWWRRNHVPPKSKKLKWW